MLSGSCSASRPERPADVGPLSSDVRRHGTHHFIQPRIMSERKNPRQLQVGWGLLVGCQSAHAAADGASGLFDVVFLLLVLASPVLVLLLGLALWRWAWAQKVTTGESSGAEATVDEPPKRVESPTGSRSSSTEAHPEYWRTVPGRVTLAYLAITYVAAPCGSLVDSVFKWWKYEHDAIAFAFGPGALLCYLPVAIGLLLLLRSGRVLAAAALMAVAFVWLAILWPIGVLQINVAAYQKLSSPDPFAYMALVLPLRQSQLMIAALALLTGTLLIRSAWR